MTVFTTQLVQLSFPGDVLYVLSAHGWHVPPFEPVYPALHAQAPSVILPDGELEFPGHAEHVPRALAPTAAEYVAVAQSVHATLPVLVLYLPATQPEQTSPSGPENPALQMQAPTTELELGEFEFVGQVKHTDAALAPTVPE